MFPMQSLYTFVPWHSSVSTGFLSSADALTNDRFWRLLYITITSLHCSAATLTASVLPVRMLQQHNNIFTQITLITLSHWSAKVQRRFSEESSSNPHIWRLKLNNHLEPRTSSNHKQYTVAVAMQLTFPGSFLRTASTGLHSAAVYAIVRQQPANLSLRCADRFIARHIYTTSATTSVAADLLAPTFKQLKLISRKFVSRNITRRLDR
jgi:hypothetical protein